MGDPKPAEGSDLLRRQGEVFVVRALRGRAKRERLQAAHPGHSTPEQIAVFLSMAYFLEEAADTLQEVHRRRREEAGEAP